MKTYERPIVVPNEELAEGVYAASGSTNAGTGNAGNTGDNQSGAPYCDSIYIKGVFHPQDWSDWQGTNINVRGCEGCPANWNDGVCHVETYPKSMQGQFKPTWESAGVGPNDKANGSF